MAERTTELSGAQAWAGAIVSLVAIGWTDFASGAELRVFPLYYLPVGLVAWQGGRRAAMTAAALCAMVWMGANSLAGMEFSMPVIWVANTIMQGASFGVVGLLIATLRGSLIRERELSRTDPLTGLLNGRAFREEAETVLALCRRKERPATLAYIDLDNFKSVNDTRGHKAGDQLLQSVAAALRTGTRPSDICARLGGDEFAILLPEVDSAEAKTALDRLRVEVLKAVAPHGNGVSASIGAVAFTTVPERLDSMVSAADSRMYAAKAAGKDRVHLEVVS